MNNIIAALVPCMIVRRRLRTWTASRIDVMDRDISRVSKGNVGSWDRSPEDQVSIAVTRSVTIVVLNLRYHNYYDIITIFQSTDFNVVSKFNDSTLGHSRDSIVLRNTVDRTLLYFIIQYWFDHNRTFFTGSFVVQTERVLPVPSSALSTVFVL